MARPRSAGACRNGWSVTLLAAVGAFVLTGASTAFAQSAPAPLSGLGNRSCGAMNQGPPADQSPSNIITRSSGVAGPACLASTGNGEATSFAPAPVVHETTAPGNLAIAHMVDAGRALEASRERERPEQRSLQGSDRGASFPEPVRLEPDRGGSAEGSPSGTAAATDPENQLLQLLIEERMLLENYGKDHPQVISLRARIPVVRALVEERRRLQAERERDALRAALEARNREARTEPIIVTVPAPAAPAPASPPPAQPPIVVMMPPAEKAPAAESAPPAQSTTLAGASPESTSEADTTAIIGALAQRLPLAVLGAALLGLLLHIAILIHVVRRQRPRGHGTVRVELINGAALGTTAPAAVPARQAERPLPSPMRMHRATAESKTEPANADLPIYRQLVADNLRLRAGLAQLESAAA
jgi:hypothetical protein